MLNNTLNEIFNEVDKIDTHTNNQCMNCGANLPNEYATKCEVCGYDCISEFSCPYKVIKQIPTQNSPVTLAFCELSKKQCNVQGLDFEICSVFRSLDSLKED